MNSLPSIIIVALLASTVQAQTVPIESMRLADVFVENAWKSMEQSMPVFIAGLESQLKAGGATDSASKALAQELNRSVTRENFTKALAQVVSEKLTLEEIVELRTFLQSTVGRKYLQINQDMASSMKYYAPMIKQACEGANQKLGMFDRGSINGVCKQFY